MNYTELRVTDYEAYKRSPYFQKLRDNVGVGKKLCERCAKAKVRIPHHLNYLRLGEEKRSDYVGVCFACNHLCHFYAKGDLVPVTADGYYLTKRWQQINSFGWKMRQVKPSHIINWFMHSYQV